MYSNILLAVDGSEQNKIAVRHAVYLASKLEAKLTAVYTLVGTDLKPNMFGGDVSLEERNQIADASAKEAFDFVEALAATEGVDLEEKVLNGNPAEAIVKISEHYDMLICGYLGRTGLASLMGSVSKELVRNSKCPVLVVR